MIQYAPLYTTQSTANYNLANSIISSLNCTFVMKLNHIRLCTCIKYCDFVNINPYVTFFWG